MDETCPTAHRLSAQQTFGQIILDRRTVRALAACFGMTIGELRAAVAQLEARGLMRRGGNRVWQLVIPPNAGLAGASSTEVV